VIVSDKKEKKKDCFAKLQKLAVNTQLEARIRFKLQDLIDFRANGWKAIDTTLVARRRPSAAPTTPKKEAVKEVVSVGGKRAGSRVSQQKVWFLCSVVCCFCFLLLTILSNQSQPSSPKPVQLHSSSSPVNSPVVEAPHRSSWGSTKKDDSLTSPTLSTRRRHNQADAEGFIICDSCFFFFLV